MAKMARQHNGQEQRNDFYGRIDPHNLAPLWEVFHEVVTPQPTSPYAPSVWRYDRVRPFLMEAGALITAQEAVRRVLVLENPALRGLQSITNTLFAGLQLVLPGEIAPAHRHSQSALRLILEGSGGYTSVEGERSYMERGDFIVTGSWNWHDHGNDTGNPVIWLDGLDVPLVRFFDASFSENYDREIYPTLRPPGDSSARYGANMVPVGFEPKGKHSPIFSYPYARSREALEQMRKTEAWDPHHGLKMTFVNPADGGPAMPSISTFIQLLPKGFTTAPYRGTDGTVYTAIDGAGETVVGDTTIAWKPRDVFVVPSWAPHTHHATEESVLFSFSDRTVQEKLGLWRESRE
ncbi:MAG: gentisate 1,2-dioxygenase [bacterium]